MNRTTKQFYPIRPLLALIVSLAMATASVGGATLGEALNATNLTWTTSGTPPGSLAWSVETFMTHDGISAAQSGALQPSIGQSSTVQTTVAGPGTLTFWWSNPAQDKILTLNAAGTNLASLYFVISWSQQTIYLGPGTQTLKWICSYTPMFFFDPQRSYLDEVSYVPGTSPPIITAQPIAQSQVPGMSSTFSVVAGGTPPLSYQWQLNGTNIAGATATPCTITNVQAANLGNYTVIVSNSVNSIVSSNAAFEFGEVTAWGSPGSVNGVATSVSPGATNVLAIDAGTDWGMALKADGTMPAWGINVYGETNVPAGLTNVISIAADSQHGLALTDDGSLTAWAGYNYGETNVPAGLSGIVAIGGGYGHCLALRTNGTVAAWGYNHSGETNVPAGLTNAVAVAGGGRSSFALLANGTVTNWGSAPSPPTNLANVVAISAGYAHALGLIADGSVVAWGQNDKGQATVPAGLTNVVAVAAGAVHSLALLANGTVVAWGYGNQGITNVPVGLTNVLAIAAGDYHNLALVGNGPPVVKASVSDVSFSGDGFSLKVPSQSGRVYQLQYKNSAEDASWTSLPLVAGSGKTIALTDTAAAGSPHRIYRVLRW